MLRRFARLICILVILFSSFAWADELEGSIPNENGDYCVLIPHPPALPKGGGKVDLIAWSNTENVTNADINGMDVYLPGCLGGCAGSNTQSHDIENTTSYTLTVLPTKGSEYSCSTSVTILETSPYEPKENGCVLTAFPRLYTIKDDKLNIYLFLRWDKMENDTYKVTNLVISGTDGFRYNPDQPYYSSGSRRHPKLNMVDLPVKYTAKIYWERKNENGTFEPYIISKCSATIEGMLPTKLPVISQPVQPTKLTYNDGLEAGKQLCIDNPTSCGIAISSAINAPYTPIVYDAITNILSIPKILIPVTTEESQSYEVYEAQLKIVPTQNNDIQLRVSDIAPINKPVTSSWRDNVNAEDSIGLLKTYLTKNNRSQTIRIIDSWQNMNKAGEFLNGITQYSGDSTKQVLYVLEFFLKNSSHVLAGGLIAEGSIVRAAELIENDTGLNAAALIGGIQDLDIKIKKDVFGLDPIVSDVEVKIHQITYLNFSVQKYILSSENRMYEGKYARGLGHTFEDGVPSGLYLVEISRDGEILKQKSVFLEPKGTQKITIYL